ncbi:MAG: choice-of-anchor Q domain-containing protein, partial [Chromatiaceae bacterium]
TGANNGTSWTNAYTDLQSTLGASTCTEIWVAAGTYKPSIPASRSATFQLKTGVALYGGFAGTETLLDERAYMSNVSTLSGDIGTVGLNTDNTYHVVTGSGTNATAVLDGFTITAGYSVDGTDQNGAGMYSQSGSQTLRNLTFTGNQSGSNGGGGARINASTSTLNNVTFSNNTSSGSGGGLLVQGVSAGPVLTNVTFSNNSTISGVSGGGGMFNGANSTATLTNVTFNGNSASNGGGALGHNANVTLNIRNSIFWGNTAPVGSQINSFAVPFSLNISNSIIQGGTCPTYAACTPVVPSGSDPMLGTPGNYGGFTQTIPLGSGSPAINGTSSNCPTTDQRYQPRSSPSCDIGAYEYNLVPYVVSIAGSALTGTSATLEGIVNANNASTTVTFEYGLNTSYGSTVTATQSPVTGVLDHFVTAPISGLTPAIIYHFRVVGQNTNGTTYGSDQSFIFKGDQTLSYTSSAPASAVVGGAAYTPLATSTSGLAVTFTIDVAASSVCSISGSAVSYLTVGTCIINANQVGNTNYNAAPQVQQSFAVGKGTQAALTVVATPSTVPYGTTSALTTTGGNGTGAVTYSAGTSTGCSITGSTLSVIDASGSCNITATKAADTN